MDMKIKNIQDINVSHEHPVVFITGVTGQDGSHMVDYLLRNTSASIVAGVRLLSSDNHTNISHLDNSDRLQFVNLDLTDSHSVFRVVERIKPDYFINLAAQSFVHGSWDLSLSTLQSNVVGVVNCLEAIRTIAPNCRFYNAGSSEEFGNVIYTPQDENHPLRPRSPYGASKASARHYIKVYRESYGIYAVQGWLFNHEGTRRGKKFVTRKITSNVARIAKAINIYKKNVVGVSPDKLVFEPLELGNIDAKRDWSDAEDMVDAIWRMLNQEIYNENFPKPSVSCSMATKEHSKYVNDYVCSSNETHTIREFIEEAFTAAGINGQWYITDNDPVSEKYVWDNYENGPVTLVRINPEFYRPAEVELLLGNSTRIREELGWQPKVGFKELVKKMVDNDLRLV